MYAKKRGRGADFGELAPSDLSQNFQACIFADGGTWSTVSAQEKVFFLLPLSHQEAWCMRAEDADGSLWDGDHLGDMNEEKETTPSWQEQPSASHSIGTATGPCKALISERTL